MLTKLARIVIRFEQILLQFPPRCDATSRNSQLELLHDLGKIERPSERDWSWDLDIDPSFPEQPPEFHLIQADFLGDPDMEMKEWIVNGALPDVESYLQIAEIQNEAGPWVMLDGYISQENETLGRNIFCFIRSFLVLSSEADSFFEHLSNQNLGGRWLPEKPSVNYTFAGEIPWCETFPENRACEFSFVVEEESVQIIYHALIPVCDFHGESSRSAANNVSHATTFAKEIALDLKLIGQPQTFDLVTSTGVKATCDVSDRSDDFNNGQSLFYMREELLRDFLEENELTLVWAIWGERRYSSNQSNKLFHGSDRPDPAYAVYSFVKRYE